MARRASISKSSSNVKATVSKQQSSAVEQKATTNAFVHTTFVVSSLTVMQHHKQGTGKECIMIIHYSSVMAGMRFREYNMRLGDTN